MSSTTSPYSITAQESAVFQQKYIELVGGLSEQLPGEKAHSFFLTSGLTVEQLGKIWSLVDQDKLGTISYTQFQIAMAVAKSVRKGNSLPSYIPREVLYPSPRPLSPSYPSFRPLSPSLPAPSVPPQPTAPSYLRTDSPDGACLPAIDTNTKRKHIQQFNTLDTSRSGFLSGVQVKASMSKSFLPHTTLGKVWELADQDKDGRLSSYEFVLTMHLIECAKQGITLPDKLPPHLLPVAPQTATLPLSLKLSPSPPQADLFPPSQAHAPPLQSPVQTQLPASVSSAFPAGEVGLGMFCDDSTEPVRRDRKLSLEDMKRENFLRGQQFLQKRKSEQHQQQDRRASEVLQKKKSEEKLRVDRERAEVERRRSNSIKEIKLDKERELVQKRRQQLEEERKRLNEELDSLKSQASSLQAEEEHLDMRKVDLESRVWHQEQFITSLNRELQSEQGREEAAGGAAQDKAALQTQLKTQTNRLASLVSRKELLKRHLKSRESTQTEALRSYDSLGESVAQCNAAIERVRNEKVSLDVREQIACDSLSAVQGQLASSRQSAQAAKQRVQTLEGSVRKKQREVNAFFANRKKTASSVDSTQVLAPVVKPVVRQEDFIFDPFDTLDNTVSRNKPAESSSNDLANIFSLMQPAAVENKVIKVPAKPTGEIKVESIYETSDNFPGIFSARNTQQPVSTREPIQPLKRKQKQKQKDKQPQQPIRKEEINLTSYNTILPDDTTPPQARRDTNPPMLSPTYDTYVDSNTLLEYATAMQQRPVSMFASVDSSPSSSLSVQDNILYQPADALETKAKPPRPTRYPSTSRVTSPLASVPSSTHRLSALYDFSSSEEGLLSFRKGDLLSWRPEYDGPDDGWVGAEIDGVCGIVPESYVQKLPIRTAPPIPAPYSIADKHEIEPPPQQQEIEPTKPQQTEPAKQQAAPVEEIYAQPQKYLPRSALGAESDEQTVEAYQVEAKVAYKGRTAEQLCFEKGTLISVSKEKTQSKWLYGSYGDKSGWFPKFAVRLLATPVVKSNQFEDTFERSNAPQDSAVKPRCDIATAVGAILSPEQRPGVLHLALYDFNGTQEGDLMFKKHDKILITETIDKWMHGELDGKSGYLPASYVAKISNPGEREEVTSPIYGNIQVPTAAARHNSGPSQNKPIISSTEPTVSKLSVVQDLKNKMEQTNTVYTGSVELNRTAEPPAPISKSRSQPSQSQPQAAPRPLALAHSQTKQASASTDTSQEEHSIAPFSTLASMRFKQRGGDFCFQAGDTLHIDMSRAGGKWYRGRVESTGISGWFPCSFIPSKADTAAKPRPAEQSRESNSSPEIGAYYITLYDYHQAYEEDLTFKKGDNIKLVSVDGEWATGEFNGRQGYFPFKYVEKSHFVVDKSNGVKYSAVYPYTAQNDDEITFSTGDVINLISKSTDNWWRGELRGKIGLFPANYVQELREEFKKNDTHSMENELEFVITEIVSSELSYLTDLQLVDELVFQPIEKNRLLTQNQLKQIMVNWRELVAVSRRMVEGMQSDRDQQKCFEVMAGLFHSQVPSLQRFVTWCSNQSSAISLLQKKLETDASIRELQAMWGQDPRTAHLPISSFMLKPMQRITKYQLFLKRLLELCPAADSALKSQLDSALSQLEQICIQANEGVRTQENKSRVEWVMNHLEFAENEVICKNIIHTRSEISRKLMYTGKLVKTNSNKELVGFLFNDLLLLTRPSKNLFQRHISSSDLFEDEECKLINYRCPYKLSNVVSVKSCVGDECCFLLEVFDSLENQIRSLQLRAENHTSCMNWVSQLAEGMERCREDRLFDVSSYQDASSGSLAEALRSEYSFSRVTGDVDLS